MIHCTEVADKFGPGPRRSPAEDGYFGPARHRHVFRFPEGAANYWDNMLPCFRNDYGGLKQDTENTQTGGLP